MIKFKIDRKYLPSKKFLISLSIAAFIILLTLIISTWKKNPPKQIEISSFSDITASSSIMNLDSDKDGMPDWKEALYGTDPKKTDTDGDGTDDNDEIALSRDPLKANTALKNETPTDLIDPLLIEKNQKILDEYEKLSATEKFSRDLFSNIIASQPTNGSMDQNTINSIVEKAIQELPQKNYYPITKSTDLNLQKTDSSNLNKNMTDYINNYYTETQKLKPILGTDINIINSYIDSNNVTDRSKMLKLTEKYQEIINNLIKMPVPVAIGYYDINYHLAIINYLEVLVAVDKDIVNSNNNYLSVFPDLSVYFNVIKNLFATLTTIDSILKIER